MKSITHKKLMQKNRDGEAEVNAWIGLSSPCVYADVTFHTMRSSKREVVEVRNVPATQQP